MCGNIHVLACTPVLLPGSPGTKCLSNQYKCNLRTQEERNRKGMEGAHHRSGGGAGWGEGYTWGQVGFGEKG